LGPCKPPPKQSSYSKLQRCTVLDGRKHLFCLSWQVRRLAPPKPTIKVLYNPADPEVQFEAMAIMMDRISADDSLRLWLEGDPRRRDDIAECSPGSRVHPWIQQAVAPGSRRQRRVPPGIGNKARWKAAMPSAAAGKDQAAAPGPTVR